MNAIAAGVALGLAQAAGAPAAAPPPPGDPFAAIARPLLERHCLECHGAAARSGLARLDGPAGARAARQEGELWQEAIARIEAVRMPPKTRPPLAIAEREALAAALKETLTAREPDEVDDPGVVTLRRLGRFEYDRSIRALLGIDWSSGDLFPADPIAHGIDDLGDVQALPSMLFEKYDEASRAIVARLLADDAKRERLLAPALANGGRLDAAAAHAILAPLAERAFRRPVAPEELAPRLELFRARQAAGAPAVDALATALRTLLMAPDFLFRPESGDPARESEGVRPLTGFELATRLSYFLWSEPPDDALLAAAQSGELDQADGLRRQARRLLADPRAHTLSEHFAAQWLGFGGIADVAVDIRRFGRFFGLGLRERFHAQALEFVATLVREDRDVRDLIDSDWTMADATLAAYYGLPAPAGGGLQRVPLTAEQRHRGGLLGLGAILATTSFPLRTSPVLRGKWILGTLLDREPPPPPAAVPALPKDDRQSDALTLRQRLERHRADPGCAGCHATMDPLGFALENYDAIGGWRATHEPAPESPASAAPLPPIDARATLPDGSVIDGPLGLRDWLRGEEQAFLRAFTRRLFTFAVGRPPGWLDEGTIGAIVADARADGARFGRFVEGIVSSRPFRYLRAPR
ncbi:MAG: DUF1592 domain-containing protein [Planctomycetes bacterium]|nr:DUF1592 domain-containing protein [Planctomycetota bacterium]